MSESAEQEKAASAHGAADAARGAVVVLGATSPIGEHVCRLAAEEGRPVAVASRRLEDVEAIASDIGVRFPGSQVRAYAFDALEMDAHRAFFEDVEADLGSIERVVVMFGDIGVHEQSIEEWSAARRVLDVNFTGAASASEAAVPALLRWAAAHPDGRPRPALVGVASVAGDRGRQSNYLYGAAKGGYALYLQGLRNRLFGEGVHVVTMKYGFIDTPMTDGLETAIPLASPGSAARAAMRAADRGRNVVYFPWFWRGIMAVIRGIPELVFKRLSL